MATKLTLLLVLALAGLALHARSAVASSLDAPDERMDIIEDTTAVSTTTDAPPHGRNLLSTPCRRRRSAAWLAAHPRKTGPKEVHHDRPRLPWCDEVDIEVVVAAAVGSTPEPASSFDHCKHCRFSRDASWSYIALESVKCIGNAGTEKCTVPDGSPNAGDVCWDGNDSIQSSECFIPEIDTCADACTHFQNAKGAYLSLSGPCTPAESNGQFCETADGFNCHYEASPGNFQSGCRYLDEKK